jgi:hypothetical protein
MIIKVIINLGKIHNSIMEGKLDALFFVVDGVVVVRFKVDLKKGNNKAILSTNTDPYYKNSITLAKIRVQNLNIRDLDQYPYSTNINEGQGLGWRKLEPINKQHCRFLHSWHA